MSKIKVFGLVIGLMTLLAFSFFSVTSAQSFKAEDTITIGKDQTVNSLLVAFGSRVDIQGTINGDVYCAGQTVSISGVINGDVICAGENVMISGKVNGDVRLAGYTVNIGGYVRGSGSFAAQSLQIDNNSVITSDILGFAETMNISGAIGRDIAVASTNTLINGEVGRDIKGHIENLTIGSSGVVNGNIDYTSLNDPLIIGSGEVKGDITIYEPDYGSMNNQSSASMAFMGFVFFSASMLLIGMILIALFPRLINDTAQSSLKTPGKVILLGILSLVLTPIAIIILLISAFGVPLAILLGLIWIVILMLSMPFAGYALGYAVLNKTTKKPGWIMLVGLSLLCITYFIPVINFFAVLSVGIFGSGMILSESQKLLARIPTNKKTNKSLSAN